MKYAEFLDVSSLTKNDLLAFGHNSLIEDPPEVIPSLPAPPMLMFDRITTIEHNGRKGSIVAEQDIHLDDWFFMCHFRNDPVQPGCLGVDAIWQLIGLYGALRGARGSGRALGCQEIEFFGQIRPYNKIVTYRIEIRRYSQVQGNAMIIGSGDVLVDGEAIYRVENAKVGIFKDIQYPDYPHRSKNSIGGVMKA